MKFTSTALLRWLQSFFGFTQQAASSPIGSSMNSTLATAKWFADHHNRPWSEPAVRVRLPSGADAFDADRLARALDVLGLRSTLAKRQLRKIDPAVLPCVLHRTSGEALILIDLADDRRTATVYDPVAGGAEEEIRTSKLTRNITRDVLFVTPKWSRTEAGGTFSQTRDRTHWFWSAMRAQKGHWLQIATAALCINLLGLALPIFVMNVYDRVIPNTAFVTLWTLAFGVAIAIGLDLALRGIRGHILERLGSQLDTSLAASLFAHAMAMRPHMRSTGIPHLASHIRDFETVRDFFGSASFVALIDMFFVGLFIWVLWIIVGPLGLVPLVAVPAALALASICQIPMARIAKDAHDLSGQRQSILNESILGHESIKTLNAEPLLQREWERVSAASARVNGRSRFWSMMAISGTQMIQQTASVAIIVWGVFLVASGQITVGALIAANILAGRALAPMAAMSNTIFRAQYARKALRTLSAFMAMPTEAGPGVVSAAKVRDGRVELDKVSFRYPGADHDALCDVSLAIAAGESVAILGRVGSGKSTLGKVLCGLLEPDRGSLLIDGRGARQYDPAELRDGIGYMPQDPDLFTGTIRENLMIGRPWATIEELDKAIDQSGLRGLIASDPAGLARSVGEQGAGLSGGQRQGLALARLLVRRPKVLFLDEPTNAMDQEMESWVAASLGAINGGGTGLIVCTHRPSLAGIAERWIVMDQGRIVLDGDRNTVMARLQSGASSQKAAE